MNGLSDCKANALTSSSGFNSVVLLNLFPYFFLSPDIVLELDHSCSCKVPVRFYNFKSQLGKAKLRVKFLKHLAATLSDWGHIFSNLFS